ncbi:MAG: hypothetical protein GXY58_03945 [Planctomycetaceae bacterium]|nr:hypothetical protein [Planctomycetaceae bacterium]
MVLMGVPESIFWLVKMKKVEKTAGLQGAANCAGMVEAARVLMVRVEGTGWLPTQSGCGIM